MWIITDANKFKEEFEKAKVVNKGLDGGSGNAEEENADGESEPESEEDEAEAKEEAKEEKKD